MDALEKGALIFGIFAAVFLAYALVMMMLFYDPTEPRIVKVHIPTHSHIMQST